MDDYARTLKLALDNNGVVYEAVVLGQLGRERGQAAIRFLLDDSLLGQRSDHRGDRFYVLPARAIAEQIVAEALAAADIRRLPRFRPFPRARLSELATKSGWAS